ncbi:MAG: asparagine synthase (glutamine-hydrolyzing) [Planctomycetes bacterium]|nr:asparagine synthase (glutamine-hydrolyzing) [Planctomycetota bacterium]
MCGIAGMVGGGNQHLLEEMRDRLRHRGPDAAGIVIWPDAGLAHRRLSIIDLEGGRQPMSNEDGSVWVVFNGEIYNHRELRERLEQRGHRFTTSSDTEVIVHLYEDLEAGCVSQLRGDFAFAVWDRNRGQLLLARDRLGVKPLYFAELGDQLVFASEIKSLLVHPAISREVDCEALDLYLSYLYIPAPHTAFRQIRKLPQASYGVYRRGHWSVTRYWSPSDSVSPCPRSFDEAAQQVREQLAEAVRIRLMSDVPLGAFLSGGIDSSSVVALMATSSDRPVKTFTVRFPAENGLYDEGAIARETARHFGTDHTELIINADAAELLPHVVRHFDEPFGNPTALLLYRLAEETRRSVTVALSGDGGDELFGGYPRYRGLRWLSRYRHVPRRLRSLIRRAVAGRLHDSADGRMSSRRLREFLEVEADEPWAGYARWVGYHSGFDKASLYTSDFLSQCPAADEGQWLHGVARRVDTAAPSLDLIGRASVLDMETFLPENVLQYSDRMSMAHGLELRVPFTDYVLIERVLSMPDNWRLGWRHGKRVLRAAMRDLLPPAVLKGSKLGFNPPMAAWLRGSLGSILDEHLSEPAVRQRGLFRPERVRHLREQLDLEVSDWSLHLWALVMLESWMRAYIDTPLSRSGVLDLPETEPAHPATTRAAA